MIPSLQQGDRPAADMSIIQEKTRAKGAAVLIMNIMLVINIQLCSNTLKAHSYCVLGAGKMFASLLAYTSFAGQVCRSGVTEPACWCQLAGFK